MYLEIDEGFLEHPKTLQLCALMGNPLAFGHMLHFWRWACRSCKDGNLTGLTPYVIEEAARYTQHDGKLFAAMVAKLGDDPGFLDVDDNGAVVGIHNWSLRTGGAITRMDAKVKANKERRDATRMRNKSSTDAGIVPASMPEQCRHDAGQTRQDKTRQDPDPDPHTQTREVPPLSQAGKPSAYNVVSQYMAIRSESLGNGMANSLVSTPQRGDVDRAAAWLSDMTADQVKDIEPAIRLACTHVKRGDPGWTNPAMTQVAFLWAAIVSHWNDLREELHGCAPKITGQQPASKADPSKPRFMKSVTRPEPNGGNP